MIIVVISRILLCLYSLLASIASSGCLVSKGLRSCRYGCGTVAPCSIDMRGLGEAIFRICPMCGASPFGLVTEFAF